MIPAIPATMRMRSRIVPAVPRPCGCGYVVPRHPRDHADSRMGCPSGHRFTHSPARFALRCHGFVISPACGVRQDTDLRLRMGYHPHYRTLSWTGCCIFAKVLSDMDFQRVTLTGAESGFRMMNCAWPLKAGMVKLSGAVPGAGRSCPRKAGSPLPAPSSLRPSVSEIVTG